LTALGIVGSLLLAACWRLARRALPQLSVQREAPGSAGEEDTVAVTLSVENHGSHAVQLLGITDTFGAAVTERQVLLEPGPLRGRRRRRLTYRTICSRQWGVYTMGPIALRTADPLGLFEARRLVIDVVPFAVFPRLYPVAGIGRLGTRPTLAPRQATLGRSGQSANYLGVRDYRPGDELRRVHWPATARRGVPVVKEYECDLLPYFTLFLDLARSHRAGTGLKSTFEYVVRTAASLLADAIGRGDTVQLFAEGKASLFVPPGRGDLHLAHCLHGLVRARQEGTMPILELVEHHRPHIPERSTAAILSATISGDDRRLEALVDSLAARGVRVLLLFIDDSSFLAIDRPALSRQQAAVRRARLGTLMREHGVPGAILGGESDLATELGRPDLFFS
jgi:uncharacterized protein (DUF58 family)